VTEWFEKWESNGWRNSKGQTVVNKGLIMRALELKRKIEDGGKVIFRKVDRELNRQADSLARQGCEEAKMGESGRQDSQISMTGYAVVVPSEDFYPSMTGYAVAGPSEESYHVMTGYAEAVPY
jgi:ribonuclease HI